MVKDLSSLPPLLVNLQWPPCLYHCPLQYIANQAAQGSPEVQGGGHLLLNCPEADSHVMQSESQVPPSTLTGRNSSSLLLSHRLWSHGVQTVSWNTLSPAPQPQNLGAVNTHLSVSAWLIPSLPPKVYSKGILPVRPTLTTLLKTTIFIPSCGFPSPSLNCFNTWHILPANILFHLLLNYIDNQC